MESKDACTITVTKKWYEAIKIEAAIEGVKIKGVKCENSVNEYDINLIVKAEYLKNFIIEYLKADKKLRNLEHLCKITPFEFDKLSNFDRHDLLCAVSRNSGNDEILELYISIEKCIISEIKDNSKARDILDDTDYIVCWIIAISANICNCNYKILSKSLKFNKILDKEIDNKYKEYLVYFFYLSIMQNKLEYADLIFNYIDLTVLEKFNKKTKDDEILGQGLHKDGIDYLYNMIKKGISISQVLIEDMSMRIMDSKNEELKNHFQKLFPNQ